MTEKARGLSISQEEAAWIWLQNSAPYPVSPVILLQTKEWLRDHPEKYHDILKSIGPVPVWDYRKLDKGPKSQ